MNPIDYPYTPDLRFLQSAYILLLVLLVYMVHQFQSQLDLKVVVLKTKFIFKIGPAMNKIVKQKLSLRTSVVQLCTYTSHFTPLSKMLSLLNCRLSIWSKNVRFTLLNEIHIMN